MKKYYLLFLAFSVITASRLSAADNAASGDLALELWSSAGLSVVPQPEVVMQSAIGAVEQPSDDELSSQVRVLCQRYKGRTNRLHSLEGKNAEKAQRSIILCQQDLNKISKDAQELLGECAVNSIDTHIPELMNIILDLHQLGICKLK